MAGDSSWLYACQAEFATLGNKQGTVVTKYFTGPPPSVVSASLSRGGLAGWMKGKFANLFQVIKINGTAFYFMKTLNCWDVGPNVNSMGGAFISCGSQGQGLGGSSSTPDCTGLQPDGASCEADTDCCSGLCTPSSEGNICWGG